MLVVVVVVFFFFGGGGRGALYKNQKEAKKNHTAVDGKKPGTTEQFFNL